MCRLVLVLFIYFHILDSGDREGKGGGGYVGRQVKNGEKTKGRDGSRDVSTGIYVSAQGDGGSFAILDELWFFAGREMSGKDRMCGGLYVCTSTIPGSII